MGRYQIFRIDTVSIQYLIQDIANIRWLVSATVRINVISVINWNILAGPVLWKRRRLLGNIFTPNSSAITEAGLAPKMAASWERRPKPSYLHCIRFNKLARPVDLGPWRSTFTAWHLYHIRVDLTTWPPVSQVPLLRYISGWCFSVRWGGDAGHFRPHPGLWLLEYRTSNVVTSFPVPLGKMTNSSLFSMTSTLVHLKLLTIIL